MQHRFYTSFNGGEVTPLLGARYDLEKYLTSCRKLENFRIMQYGGVRYRSGFRYIDNALGENSRIIPFQFSTNTRFLLELADRKIGFFSNKQRVMLGGSRYTIDSPYSAAELREIQYKQINDIMYLVHPSHHPRKLSRYGDTDWRLEEVNWTWPPMLDENSDEDLYIDVDAWKEGTVSATMTANKDIFTREMEGAYWQLKYLRDATGLELNIQFPSDGTDLSPVYSGSIKVKGKWMIMSNGNWWGTVQLYRTYDIDNASTADDTGWERIGNYFGKSDRTINETGEQDESAYFRIKWIPNGYAFTTSGTNPPWVGTVPTSYTTASVKLEVGDAYISGVVRIREGGFADARTVAVDIIKELEQAGDTGFAKTTNLWNEGAWSPYRGYPRAIGLFEQRLYIAGTKNNPIRLWGSKMGDFENFELTDLDDSAVAFDVASTESNMIMWLDALDKLQIGTSGGEFICTSGGDGPITPSSIVVRGQSSYGSDTTGALSVDDIVLFIQRQGRAVREMSYDLQRDRYVSPDITLLCKQVTESGIIETSFCRQPDPMYLAVLGNGELGAMTYNREQNITGWSRFITEGKFKSVASIYGKPEDEIWVVVERSTIGADGVERVLTTVEVMEPESDNIKEAIHLDCATTGVVGGTTIPGLTQYSGKTVSIVVDGAEIDQYKVPSSGDIKLPDDAIGKFVIIGYPYKGYLLPMIVDIGMNDGVSQGRPKRITKVTVRLNHTLGLKYGRHQNKLDDVKFREFESHMDEAIPLFSGDKDIEWPNDYDYFGDIYLSQQAPHPCTILGFSIAWEVTGV